MKEKRKIIEIYVTEKENDEIDIDVERVEDTEVVNDIMKDLVTIFTKLF